MGRFASKAGDLCWPWIQAAIVILAGAEETGEETVLPDSHEEQGRRMFETVVKHWLPLTALAEKSSWSGALATWFSHTTV